MDSQLHEFTRISILRMCEHYLPKMQIALVGLDQEILWRREKEALNSIGGIVLHIDQHIQRHVIRYSNGGKVEGGIENHFPDETALSSADLIERIAARFHAWRDVMAACLEQDQADSNLDMFDIYHLVEHTGYHLGQIIDRVQRLTDRSFRFVQNGINERSLRERM